MIQRTKVKRDKIFTDFHYYQPATTRGITQQQYEQRLPPKQARTFHPKKKPIFNDLNYSSRHNPLARGKANRFDKTYKETYQRKKKVSFLSDKQTDPLSLRYQPPSKVPRTRPEYRNSATLQVELQKKFEIPAQRKLSNNYKNYHIQLGMSQSLQRLPRMRDTLNSSLIDPVLKYAQANHSVEKITWKIGSRYL